MPTQVPLLIDVLRSWGNSTTDAAADEIERLRKALSDIATKRTPQGMPPSLFAEKILEK